MDLQSKSGRTCSIHDVVLARLRDQVSEDDHVVPLAVSYFYAKRYVTAQIQQRVQLDRPLVFRKWAQGYSDRQRSIGVESSAYTV